MSVLYWLIKWHFLLVLNFSLCGFKDKRSIRAQGPGTPLACPALDAQELLAI